MARRLACSHADTNSQSWGPNSPCFTAFTDHHLLGVCTNTTRLNSSNLGFFLLSKTQAGSLKCTANELNLGDTEGNGQCEPVTVNVGCQIKRLSKCQHLIKPFSLRPGVACTWPSTHMAREIKGRANEICVWRRRVIYNA